MNVIIQKLHRKQLPRALELSNLFKKIAKAAPTCEEASYSLLFFGKALESAREQASFEISLAPEASKEALTPPREKDDE